MSALLTANDLCFSRNENLIFDKVNFTLAAGDLLKITGPNGSGKSTLLKILAGFLTGFSGTLLYQGKSFSSKGHFYQNVCYLGHQLGIKSSLTVVENLAFFRDFLAINPKQEVEDVLDQLQLWHLQDERVVSLSAGQKQRIALSRFLLTDATLWLLDEPFTAMDTQGIAFIEQILSGHINQGGAVVMTSHHPVNIACKQLIMPEIIHPEEYL